MRSDAVEVGPELVEPALLGRAVAGRWDGGLGFEGAVHALVAAILLGAGGLDEIGQDAELDPPDGEPVKASQGKG